MQTVKNLLFKDREIILVGTAHISKESIKDVESSIREMSPDCVAVELDEQRYESVKNPESWKNLDIVKVLKEKRGFIMMANLVLSSFQRRMGADVGVKPGDEMRSALNIAEELDIPVVMADRPVQTTLRRAWAKNSLWGKVKLLSALLASAFEKEEISAEDIENLKSSNEMDSMMAELAQYLPAVKEVLIDERDRYLASRIWECRGNKTLAVLGAGHLPGVEKHLNALAAGTEQSNTADIENVPPAGIGGKIAGWIFPVLLAALIIAGFFTGGAATSVDMLVSWILWNGSLAALGTLLACGHPLAIITGFVGAPLGTLNPFLAVGIFTGLVQAWMCKPKVEDMEFLAEDALTLKGFYKNRIGRVLLVFFLSSLGGAIGNFIAVPALISSLLH
ncbi:TraB/GumN family protein [Treponema sp. OMZ 840]|uniref:TraB/GumN family protein n=1 Tax=Treponema sp. OMZ 840 TaxID=244313 RepID=UPI003D9014BA